MRLESSLPLMSFEDACTEVVRYLKASVPLGFWSVSRQEDGRQVYVSVQDDVYGRTVGDSHGWSDSYCQFMVTGEAPQIAPDAMAVPRFAAAGVTRELRIGAYVGVPIRAGDGSLFGTICGLDPEIQPASLLDHAPVLRLLADLLGRVLEAEALRAEAEERSVELHRLALHDQLTGLPNRAMFLDRLQHAVDLHLRDHRPVAVLLFDLDDFKAVNDRLGHAAGDDLLVRVGDRVLGALRAGDTLARLSGDEFAVLLEDGGDPLVTGRRILASMHEPFVIAQGGAQLTAAVSMGVADLAAQDEPVAAETLLSHADIAMYSAKGAGKHRVVRYDPVMTLPAARDLALRDPLRRAVSTGGIDVVYQPIIDLRSGAPVAFEALARWRHDGEDIPPDVFVPMAARADLLPELTAHVLEVAAAQLARWSVEVGHRSLRASVNIPPAMIADPSFPDAVAGVISRHALAPGQLVLEITEDSLLADLPVARAVAARLRGLGAGLALDDFGTGYSSLVHLRQIPLQYLKIDRGFTGDLDTNPDTERFMRALLALGADLGLHVVVEGVERPEQADVLRQLGCRYAQGFLFARPGPAPTGLPTADLLRI
ncbi:diguanylate cyclase (GGDEF) domain-containing protein [Blastococcus sp. DSM 46786]|uniref:bifunctional diguanylate cyclase/phosphodiesterase n=1 Tax=Blastococcus sp. DSM 46786 TaxID=1798227 RepID=UPI0008C12E7B|nr:EAL domain-containing protein [Blastococcus sp. DSM 46786]SEM15859.1 diguanylate cyclase (GGDEF) domain-containing protein [Blastococcus sp. DSM 46786]